MGLISKVISLGKKAVSLVGVDRLAGWAYAAYMKWFKSADSVTDKLLAVASLGIQIGVVVGFIPSGAAAASVIHLVAYNLGDFIDNGKLDKSYKV